MKKIREYLARILALLRAGNENYQSDQIDTALAGSDEDLKTYISSNELWGGAGSIADQALVEDRPSRRKLEALLADLGELQMAIGIVNERTDMWTSAFRKWQKEKI